MTLRKRFVAGYCSNTNKDNVSLFSFPKDASFSRHCVQFVTGIARNLCCGGWEPRRLRRRVRDAESVEAEGTWGWGSRVSPIWPTTTTRRSGWAS